MNGRTADVDVAALPDHAFGHHGLIWWGTVSFMVIEGTMFVTVLVTYYYLRLRVPFWPPGVPEPSLTWGTLNTLILVISCIPNHFAKVAAEKYDLAGVRWWMVLAMVSGAAFLVVRGFEFAALGVAWDSNAYGSVVWVLMGLHTTHLATDFLDSGVLTVLMFTRHGRELRRFADISENGLYWYFVVASWIPIYLTVYFAPRWL
jgi:heme/copper-type cytochrome/quinol oxidase subunit 3